jgi:hypothetical protein
MIEGKRKRNDAEDIDGNVVIDQPCPILIIHGPARCDAAPARNHAQSFMMITRRISCRRSSSIPLQ